MNHLWVRERKVRYVITSLKYASTRVYSNSENKKDVNKVELDRQVELLCSERSN